MKSLQLRIATSAALEGVLGLASFASGDDGTDEAWWSREDVPQSTAEAITAVGDPTGEVWFHLLGAALEASGDYADFVDRVAAMAPADLLGLILGREVPAWKEVVPEGLLDQAARGAPDAGSKLLGIPGYYGGHARRALGTLLQLSPEEGAQCVVEALSSWSTVVAQGASLIRVWQAEQRRRFAKLTGPTLKRIEVATGVRYEPETYVREVVLIPRLSGDGLVLAQHGTSRLMVFSPERTRDPLTSLSEVFFALGERSRLEILALLAARPRGVSEIADATSLAKSTVHQHLRLLRRSGAITLTGQAWRYRYEVDRERLNAAMTELIEMLDRWEDNA